MEGDAAVPRRSKRIAGDSNESESISNANAMMGENGAGDSICVFDKQATGEMHAPTDTEPKNQHDTEMCQPQLLQQKSASTCEGTHAQPTVHDTSATNALHANATAEFPNAVMHCISEMQSQMYEFGKMLYTLQSTHMDKSSTRKSTILGLGSDSISPL